MHSNTSLIVMLPFMVILPLRNITSCLSKSDIPNCNKKINDNVMSEEN
jgi:hypothetical protein